MKRSRKVWIVCSVNAAPICTLRPSVSVRKNSTIVSSASKNSSCRLGEVAHGRVKDRATVEPDLIATKMLAFHSKSSRNKNFRNLIMIAIS